MAKKKIAALAFLLILLASLVWLDSTPIKAEQPEEPELPSLPETPNAPIQLAVANEQRPNYRRSNGGRRLRHASVFQAVKA